MHPSSLVSISPHHVLGLLASEWLRRLQGTTASPHASTLSSWPLHVTCKVDQLPHDAPEQTPDYLALLHHPGVPPHQLDLKLNAICALQRNLCVDVGLIHNGHVRITAVHRRFVEVSLHHESQAHCVPRISFTFTPPASDWTVTRKQFPLRLAYATTFNGCQGLTLSRSVVDLRIDPFAHGQLYTALSTVRRREDTLILFTNSNEEQTCANVVYKKLLL